MLFPISWSSSVICSILLSFSIFCESDFVYFILFYCSLTSKLSTPSHSLHQGMASLSGLSASLLSYHDGVMSRVCLTCQRLKENLSHRVDEGDSILTVGCDLVRRSSVTSCHKVYVVNSDPIMTVYACLLPTNWHVCWQLSLDGKTSCTTPCIVTMVTKSRRTQRIGVISLLTSSILLLLTCCYCHSRIKAQK